MPEIMIIDRPLSGVVLLQCPRYADHRGDLTKLYHANTLAALGLTFRPVESFITRSKAGVVRGMHFQINEAAHDKLVFCPKGRVLDVVVDIRPESPEFNKPVALELSEDNNMALLIGKGYAHGFLAKNDDSWMIYSTTTVHNQSLDRGVLWSSINFDWGIESPTISKRDLQHPKIEELECGF